MRGEAARPRIFASWVEGLNIRQEFRAVDRPRSYQLLNAEDLAIACRPANDPEFEVSLAWLDGTDRKADAADQVFAAVARHKDEEPRARRAEDEDPAWIAGGRFQLFCAQNPWSFFIVVKFEGVSEDATS